MTLKELGIGESARIKTVGGDGASRQHFLDMGVIPKAEVTVVKFAPMGILWSCDFMGMNLLFVLMMHRQIEVEPIQKRSRNHEGPKELSKTAHPGLGEEGKYHVKGEEDPLPAGRCLHMHLSETKTAGKPRF